MAVSRIKEAKPRDCPDRPSRGRSGDGVLDAAGVELLIAWTGGKRPALLQDEDDPNKLIPSTPDEPLDSHGDVADFHSLGTICRPAIFSTPPERDRGECRRHRRIGRGEHDLVSQVAPRRTANCPSVSHGRPGRPVHAVGGDAGQDGDRRAGRQGGRPVLGAPDDIDGRQNQTIDRELDAARTS